MTQVEFDELIARLASDPAFGAALAASATLADAQRIAAEYGFDITLNEIDAARTNGVLSDTELARVIGGNSGNIGV